MLCPVCRTDMLVLEFEQVEIDYCAACGGVWLDSGELELIGERIGALGRGLLSALESARPGGRPAGGSRRCPVGRERLREVTAPTSPPITLDRCPRGHGIWFDRGELRAVVRAAGADEDNVLARFFRDLERPREGEGTTRRGP